MSGDPISERSRARRGGWRERAWLLMIPLLVLLYANSFSGFSIIEQKHSVLGDADASNYTMLLRNFALHKKLGNEWNAQNRSIGDNAQKHKIHHITYALTGSAMYRLARPVYRMIGVPPEKAVFAVNALIAVVNLGLLWLLLKRSNPNRNPVFPFLVFYALALSTWVFSSVPESWPFSATLVLLFLLLLRRRPLHPALIGAALGLVMLNNVFLAALFALAFLEFLRAGGGLGTVLRKSLVAGVISIATWAGGLTALSVFDSSFRPDHFVRYTIWFKQFTGASLPRTDPYVWQSAGTNLFVNSIVSNQPDAGVPQEALKTTLAESPLGAAATAVWLIVALVAVIAFAKNLRNGWRSERWPGLLSTNSLDLALWCATMLGVTVLLFYPSGFLYSTVVVPALALFLCQNLNLHVTWQRALFFGTLALMLVNNTAQVMVFREALSVLSG
ncbi:MAG: hypothetical protein WEE89_21025 [Gemmatimonadota bacterium]